MISSQWGIGELTSCCGKSVPIESSVGDEISDAVDSCAHGSLKEASVEIPAIKKKFWQVSSATRFLKDECFAIE